MLNCPRNFYGAQTMLGNRESRKVGHNTYLIRRGDDVAVRYHNTDVVTFHADMTATLRNGGWDTVTTRKRFKACGFSVYRDRGETYVGQAPKVISANGDYSHTEWSRLPFESGMRLKVAL
jgi:hypothetical protein